MTTATTATAAPESRAPAANHQNDTLPVPNSTLSYWREKPHRLDTHRTTPDLPASCDVAIIGSGMAGVSVAYHLASTSSTPHPPSTLLLEARQLCSGATGRNGGHVKAKTATLLSLLSHDDDDDDDDENNNSSSNNNNDSNDSNDNDDNGLATANALSAFVQAQIAALAAVTTAAEPGLAAECDFQLRRSWDVFVRDDEATARVARAWRRCVARGDEWTAGREMIDGGDVEAVTGVRGARLAVSSPACSLWPYRFVGGLLERAMARNGRLNVQTGTGVVRVERDGEGAGEGAWLVCTDRGVVRARKVVFATNAYTAGLVPAYRGVITPYKGMCAHLAAADGTRQPRLSHTYNIEYGGREGLETVDYLNPRPDGGIVVGGAKWLYQEQKSLWLNTVDDSTLIEPVMKAKYFDGYMQRNFTGWDDSGSETERVWSGIMGSTPDGVPHVGKVPGEQNQWILAGFNGGGNALIFLTAKAVAKMVLEDVPFEETGVAVPAFFKTTAERLAKHS
ncbi:fad dependent oxidoreductase [Diplodia corticola]|uniref:Fad dependent oxidoreductase n=1 Tax=Diplodia corticola TaxID=236234 RepID=A0A1J9SKW4_9PEZI|nr:fad dependent oxidoreductase [Diplodia corticola]OJD40253.1 fad dependent oxidoreductase [Diplodia corticola]